MAQRAETQVTRPPPPGPRGRTLPGREPEPGLRTKFRSPATSLPRGRGPSQVRVARALRARDPLGRRLPGPQGPAGCAYPVWPQVRKLQEGEKLAGAGRRGAQAHPPRQLARLGTSWRRRPRPHPRPLPGDPRGTKGSLYQNCHDITRRRGSEIEEAGPGAGGGAGGGGRAAWESNPQGAEPR